MYNCIWVNTRLLPYKLAQHTGHGSSDGLVNGGAAASGLRNSGRRQQIPLLVEGLVGMATFSMVLIRRNTCRNRRSDCKNPSLHPDFELSFRPSKLVSGASDV